MTPSHRRSRRDLYITAVLLIAALVSFAAATVAWRTQHYGLLMGCAVCGFICAVFAVGNITRNRNRLDR